MHLRYNGALLNIVKVYFFTANNGIQNDIIFSITDVYDAWKKDTLYFGSENFDSLIQIFKKAPQKFQEVKKASQIAKEFK